MTPLNPPPETPPEPRVAHAEIKASLLLLALAALIGAFVIYVMAARGLFEETQALTLLSDDSEGIVPGMSLTFSGFPIGRVRRVELAPDGGVRILIDVSQKDAPWLRSTSIFTMERSLVGDTKIRAFSGILTDPPLPADAERTVLRGDASEQIPQVMTAMRSLLENLQQMTTSDSPLNASLGSLQSVTERMRGPHGALAGLLGSEENARKLISTLERTNTLLTKADTRLFASGGVMDESQAAIKQLHELLGETRQSLQKVDALLVDAQAIASNAKGASADLVSLRSEVERSLRKATQLIDEINRKWPFARDTEIKLP
ncbi:MAG: mammalian cell entry protein [Betaproteobacteria bacterium HGW-Betaproteobacteria-10]|nr:MAG: mammalian cell entry protein [Betaproteobacteria bacterium HGW-Betaproteobacteria-10]